MSEGAAMRHTIHRRPRILVTRQWPEAVLLALAERYDIVVDPLDRPLSSSDLARGMRDFDAICTTITDRLDKQIISQMERRAGLIANYGAGCEHIDLDAARAAGMVVTNTPDVLTQATAELAILLMLMTARRAGEGERELRAGRWPGWHPVHLMGRSLQGLRLGFVGYGRIAQATARMAQALWNMQLGYHARRAVSSRPDVPDAEYFSSLPALLETSDIVSVHCPGGPETHHLIDAAMLARFKPGALLINTARGSVVGEAALARALRDGPLAGAGLDVYEQEPRIHGHLLELENVVLLPHLGSATLDTRIAMGLRVLANVDAYFSRQVPPDRVV
jgi:lactate dehydrogenase-like 2-hydroxyacid dehydrogenase